MSSKPSIPNRLRTSSLRARAQPPKTQPDPTALSQRNLVRKPRSAIIAFGVAAIVITGTIFGAQLKTSKQVTDRSRLVASENKQDSKDTPAQAFKASNESSTVPQHNVVDNSEILEHIKLLENRRAMLNRQKNGFEYKLEALHERKRKREAQAQAQVSR